MQNISKELFQEIQKNLCRPEGTVTFEYTSPYLFNKEIGNAIIFEIPSGQHLFRLERDNALNLHFFHSSPGTDTRVASINIETFVAFKSIFIGFTWSTKEIKLFVKEKSGFPDGLISSKGIASKKQLKIGNDGNIYEIGGEGIEISGFSLYCNNEAIIQATAIEAWRETISAIDILASGTSTEGFIYESIVTNLTLTILVTGFETYTKKRFLELEKEGITSNIEKIINVFYPKKEREIGIANILKVEAEENGVSLLEYIIKRDTINFQSFKKCKEAYKQGYNLKFGELDLSGEKLNSLQKFIGYRHKIIHVSASLGMLNQENVPPEDPVFPNKETAKVAKEHFIEFIEKLHQATLCLRPSRNE